MFKFKKVASVLASALMLGSTLGIAAAATYPAPFVQNGGADVAVVHGDPATVAGTDLVAVTQIVSNLNGYVVGSGGSTDSGGSALDINEDKAEALFTTSRKLYMNDSANSYKSSLTDSQLPVLLADSDFDGDTSADVTQSIKVGSYPKVDFSNHPTDDDDPVTAIKLGTTSGNYLYNATVSFNTAVNLTHPDSVGETLDLFGGSYTIGASTTATNLYLFKSSETIGLSIGGTDPTSQTVTVNGETYTIELVSASDTSAAIKVTDSDGNADSKEISEDSSKKVQGLEVSVNLADEATSRLITQVSVGSNRLKLTSTNEVRMGSDDDLVEGTKVVLSGTDWGSTTGFTIQVFASDTDEDAIAQGSEFMDPVFGTFKVSFPGLNIAEDSSERETFEVKGSGNDKATLNVMTHTDDQKTITWYYNSSATARLADSSGDVINVYEGAQVNETEYAVVGNEENGYLLELINVFNSTTSGEDYVEFKDVFSGKTYKSDTESSEGEVTLTVEGEEYTVTYVDDKNLAGDEYVTIDYPDSSTSGRAVIYPTIQTSKGAKMFFYEPLTINLDNYDSADTDLEGLRFPDGDGYASITDLEPVNGTAGNALWNFTGNSIDQQLNTTNASDYESFTVGELTYRLYGSEDNQTIVKMVNPDTTTGGIVDLPAVGFFEEQDDSTNSAYNAFVVTMEGAGTSSDAVGVSDVAFTWGADAYWDNKQMIESDDDKYQDMDYWGTIATTDKSATSQYNAVISYPDEQVYAMVYVAEDVAEDDYVIPVSGSGTTPTSSSTNIVFVSDSEVSSVSGKNMIVIGGSCINSVAADLLGSDAPLCGMDFSDATKDYTSDGTGIGSGEYLIHTFSRTDDTVATLVAGYNAGDTTNAASALRTQSLDITSGEGYVGTTSENPVLVTETADNDSE